MYAVTRGYSFHSMRMARELGPGSEDAAKTSLSAGISLREALELLVLGLLAVVTTGLALRVFPAWDDGFTWILSKEDSGTMVLHSHADRPIVGAIMQFLNDRGALWRVAVAVHAVVWLGTGLVARRLWNDLFPQQTQFGLAAGCLAIAPVICRTQLVLFNPIFFGSVQPLLVFVAVLLVWRSKRSLTIAALSAIAGAVLVFGASLLSDYALPAALCGCVLLVGTSYTQSGRVSSERLMVAAVLFVAALAGYAVYHRLASAGSASGRPTGNGSLERAWMEGKGNSAEDCHAGLAGVARLRVGESRRDRRSFDGHGNRHFVRDRAGSNPRHFGTTPHERMRQASSRLRFRQPCWLCSPLRSWPACSRWRRWDAR